MAETEKNLKVGIVGLGKMGLLHVSILNVIPNVQLVALCDKSWIMRKLAKRTLKQSLVTDNIEEMADLDLDAVYVTTPIPSHYNIVKEVYQKNVAQNVFVEKTLSSSYAQSEELCAIADSSQGHNMVGYMKRFSVTFQKVKELLGRNVLGSLISFDAYAYSSDFVGIQKGASSGARGGVLDDLGSHVTDLSLWLFNDLLSHVKVSSSAARESDSVKFKVVGSNDFSGSFDISWVRKGYRMPEFGLKIHGSEGTIKVDDNELMLVLDRSESKKWYRQDLDDHVSFLLGESEYFREDDLFINSIIFGGKAEPTFQTATKVDQLLERVRSGYQ